MERLIVLADDDPDFRLIYGEALRREGYRVVEASNGDEAVALVHKERPRLLLLDVWMPTVNGFEVLDRLRHDPDASTMKVVMLSNLDDAETRLEGFSAGIRDYWVKGLSIEALLDRVRLAFDDPSTGPEPDPF